MTNEMTATGLDHLKKQYDDVHQKLKDIAGRIKEARDLGDLSENAEYQEAKNEQAFLLGREAELEQKIKSAKVVAKCDDGVVGVGCRVKIEGNGNTMTFEIVGPDEVDPLAGRISPESPIGSAIRGHRSGETVQVKTPGGVTEYRIVEVN
ncbi:MAG: transcription elongation factor GreA [Patescibacteria group bacterium]|jgi:transcription elongation factor GreA